MKTLASLLLLAVGAVVVSQPAAALQITPSWNTGCGLMNGICKPLPSPTVPRGTYRF